MRPMIPARGAGEFADLVEHPDATSDGRFADLLEVVADLRGVTPPPPPRPEFVATLRERLLAEAETVLVAGDATDRRLVLAPPATRRQRATAVAVGTIAALGATTSMAVAAQGALPGSTLYPVKQLIERAQLSLAGDDVDQGRQLLDQARDRLAEVTSLVDRAEEPLAVPGTLDAFSDQARRGADLLLADYRQSGREASVQSINEFTSEAIEGLEALDGRVPTAADDELAEAGRTLLEIDRDAREACPSCTGGGITQMPRFLLTADGVAADDPLGDLGDLRDRADDARADDTDDGDARPDRRPTERPTRQPTELPTALPTDEPSGEPSSQPSSEPSTSLPTRVPTVQPTRLPTLLPTALPTALPTLLPSQLPTVLPTLFDPVLTALPTLLPLPTLPGQGPSGLLDGVDDALGGTVGGLLGDRER